MSLKNLKRYLLRAYYKFRPPDYGIPKANFYLALKEIPISKPLWLMYQGKKIPYEEGKNLAEEFIIGHLVGGRHITEMGFVLSGLREDLPQVHAYLEMEPETYQQILHLQMEFDGHHNVDRKDDPHFLPELQWPDQPYRMPEDTIKWDCAKERFFLAWCYKLHKDKNKLQKPNISMSDFHREEYRHRVCDSMGDWKF